MKQANVKELIKKARDNNALEDDSPELIDIKLAPFELEMCHHFLAVQLLQIELERKKQKNSKLINSNSGEMREYQELFFTSCTQFLTKIQKKIKENTAIPA